MAFSFSRFPPTYLNLKCRNIITRHAAPNSGGMNVPGMKGRRQPVTFRPSLSSAAFAALVPAQMDIDIPTPIIGIKTGSLL